MYGNFIIIIIIMTVIWFLRYHFKELSYCSVVLNFFRVPIVFFSLNMLYRVFNIFFLVVTINWIISWFSFRDWGQFLKIDYRSRDRVPWERSVGAFSVTTPYQEAWGLGKRLVIFIFKAYLTEMPLTQNINK